MRWNTRAHILEHSTTKHACYVKLVLLIVNTFRKKRDPSTRKKKKKHTHTERGRHDRREKANNQTSNQYNQNKQTNKQTNRQTQLDRMNDRTLNAIRTRQHSVHPGETTSSPSCKKAHWVRAWRCPTRCTQYHRPKQQQKKQEVW